MKAHSIWLFVGLALITFSVPGNALGEIPKRSQANLAAAATHAFTGVVQHTYSRTETKGNFEFTHSVVEILVERVDKGTDVAANDRVYVRCWRKNWLGAGNPPPDHYGHWGAPQTSDTVEVYVKGDRKSGFDVLSPNGFFHIVKAGNAPAKPKP